MTETTVEMTEEDKDRRPKAPGDTEPHRRQRSKNIATALAIVAFCVLVYFVSIIRMSGG